MITTNLSQGFNFLVRIVRMFSLHFTQQRNCPHALNIFRNLHGFRLLSDVLFCIAESCKQKHLSKYTTKLKNTYLPVAVTCSAETGVTAGPR